MSMLVRDGIELFYQKSDGPEAPLLLVHGWCCDHGYLNPQAKYFADLGHGIISVDLRGHGQSGKPQQSYVDVFADDLAWMCNELGVEKPIVIGHSMGGIVAYDLAKRYSDLPAAIVMLDSAVALPSALHPGTAKFLQNLRNSDYRTVMQRFVEDVLFIPTDDPERKNRILDSMAATPQHVMVAAYQALADFDLMKNGSGPACPCLYIQADEPSPRSDLGRLLEAAPQTLIGRTVGSGHFCQLEVPDQVNAMIKRFIALNR